MRGFHRRASSEQFARRDTDGLGRSEGERSIVWNMPGLRHCAGIYDRLHGEADCRDIGRFPLPLPSQDRRSTRQRLSFLETSIICTASPPMASLSTSVLRPQCTSCIRRITRQGLDVWAPLQQVRSISKKAKEAERNIVVKLLQDVPRFGRAGMEADTSQGLC